MIDGGNLNHPSLFAHSCCSPRRALIRPSTGGSTAQRKGHLVSTTKGGWSMGPLNSRPTAPRKVDGPPIFRESNPNERDSNYRGVSFLLLAAGNANVCGLHKESRLKFINAT